MLWFSGFLQSSTYSQFSMTFAENCPKITDSFKNLINTSYEANRLCIHIACFKSVKPLKKHVFVHKIINYFWWRCHWICERKEFESKCKNYEWRKCVEKHWMCSYQCWLLKQGWEKSDYRNISGKCGNSMQQQKMISIFVHCWCIRCRFFSHCSVMSCRM